jgi:hypothetical protein
LYSIVQKATAPLSILVFLSDVSNRDLTSRFEKSSETNSIVIFKLSLE